MKSQNPLRLLALSLLLASFWLTLPSCGTDPGPSHPWSGGQSWTEDGRSVGDIHNEILGEYRSLPRRGSVLHRVREAIRRRAKSDDVAAPGLHRRVEEVLDGPGFDVIDRRLEEARRLVQEDHPDPRALARMLEGWGIAPAEAAELGSTIAHILLLRELPESPEKSDEGEAESLFHDVLQSSTQFWTEEAALAKLTADSEVIVFDALGALGGLGLGVIGSIVGSAVYSILWKEAGVANDDTSGGCAGCH